MLSILEDKGWTSKRNNFFNVNRVATDTPNNAERIASSITDWIVGEQLCEFDFANHAFLVDNCPRTENFSLEVDEDTSVSPEELTAPRSCEDIEEEMEYNESQDYVDPTEKQKK